MKYRYLIPILFFTTWILVNFQLSRSDGLTFDEPIHLKAGQIFNQGSYFFDPMETPLIRELVARAGEYNRLAVIVLTGFLLTYVSTFLDHKSKIIFYFLALTEVNLLAHGHLFTTDLISSLFAFIYFLHISRDRPNKYLTFLFFALSLASKVATIAFVLPVCLIHFKKFKPSVWLISVLCSLIFIWLTYGFTFLPIFNHSGVVYPLGGYLRTLKENLLFSLRGQPIYFLNQIYQKSPWWKTTLVLLIKVPFPLLLMFLFSIKKSINKKVSWIFFSYLLIQSFKSLNFGIRHLLIIDLAIIYMISNSPVMLNLFQHRSILKLVQDDKIRLMFLLLFLQLSLFIKNYPNFIPFANPYVPHKELVISDSDLDWGQGLPVISQFVKKENITNYQLAYFGTDDPNKYLKNFVVVKDTLNLDRPIFISATCFHTCKLINLDQLKKKSYTLVGGSVFYFP